MKAVILAAGVGSRLRPITATKPKAMVTVAGMPILERQIRAYLGAGIKEILVVAGYRAEQVVECCGRFGGVSVTINTEYEATNNMYSLYLLREQLAGHEFILSNGDVVYDPTIIDDVVNSPLTDFIVSDRGSYADESMKIAVRDGKVIDIAKTLQPSESYGNSIDLYRFSPRTSSILFDCIRRTIEEEQRRGDWTEVAIRSVITQGDAVLTPFEIGGRRWVEIDNFEDLAIADRVFGGIEEKLARYRLYFVDLDGTIYLGDEPIPSAAEWIAELRGMGRSVYFLSNNSSRSKAGYVAKLGRMGIDVDASHIILSTDGLIEHLLAVGVTKVFVVGTEAMRQALTSAGIQTQVEQPDAVVLGYDTELTYDKLKTAALHLGRGMDLYVTHRDVVCPTPWGPIPDAGAMIALFEAATGRSPRKVFGKPNPEMIEHIIRKHRVLPEEIAIVGDRLYTDFELARNVGCDFILVLSGETKRQDVEELPQQPALIVESVADLVLRRSAEVSAT